MCSWSFLWMCKNLLFLLVQWHFRCSSLPRSLWIVMLCSSIVGASSYRYSLQIEVYSVQSSMILMKVRDSSGSKMDLSEILFNVSFQLWSTNYFQVILYLYCLDCSFEVFLFRAHYKKLLGSSVFLPHPQSLLKPLYLVEILVISLWRYFLPSFGRDAIPFGFSGTSFYWFLEIISSNSNTVWTTREFHQVQSVQKSLTCLCIFQFICSFF